MKEKTFLLTNKALFLSLLLMVAQCLSAQNDQVSKKSPVTEKSYTRMQPNDQLQINIWHGLQQKVGHLGHAQNDFNLMGNVVSFDSLTSLSYSLNNDASVGLKIGQRKFGDTRRLAASGDFNADIPITNLHEGGNTIVVNAVNSSGKKNSVTAYVEKLNGGYPLPVHIDWDKVDNPQDVGQYVDGKWALEKGGLRTIRTGYDRVFLIGDTTWMDYEVTLPFTFHKADPQTGPLSGGNGLGILMRFKGHVIGGPRNFAAGQPKWGYQPFGAIGFLRWKDGPDHDPSIQFYRGDNDKTQNFGTISFISGHKYQMKMRCMTLPDDGTEGVTRYSFKIWKAHEKEPAKWNWELDQKSLHALRRGGIALLAHHVDVTFGDLTVIPLTNRIYSVNSKY